MGRFGYPCVVRVLGNHSDFFGLQASWIDNEAVCVGEITKKQNIIIVRVSYGVGPDKDLGILCSKYHYFIVLWLHK